MGDTTRSHQEIRALLLACDPHCWYCGFRLAFFNATVDHLVPSSTGGKATLANLRLACCNCNENKSTAPIEGLACRLPRGAGIICNIGPLTMSAINTQGFDYATLPANARKSTKGHGVAIRELLDRTTANIIDVGRRLRKVHELIGREFFQKWLAAEFRWSASVASNYMTIADKFGDLQCANQFQPSALYVLGRNYVPTEAVDEAVNRAKGGEIVTKKEAQQIISKFVGPQARGGVPGKSFGKSDDKWNSQLQKMVSRLADDLGREFIAEQLVILAAQLRAPVGGKRRQKKVSDRTELQVA